MIPLNYLGHKLIRIHDPDVLHEYFHPYNCEVCFIEIFWTAQNIDRIPIDNEEAKKIPKEYDHFFQLRCDDDEYIKILTCEEQQIKNIIE